jgi:GTP-binding nuclear protein Ran
MKDDATKVKVVILGDGGVGKTSFVKRHRVDKFNAKYTPTMGVEVHPLKFNTNSGSIVLNCWDTAGQEMFAGLGSGYYTGATHFIVFFDVCNKSSFNNVPHWIEEACEVNPTAHITIVASKVDTIDCKKVSLDYMNVLEESYDANLYLCSSKSTHNIEEPILNIIRDVLGDDTNID